MKEINIYKQKLTDYLLRKDEWIFIGLILSFSLSHGNVNQWSAYLEIVIRYSVELSPALLFKFFQPKINDKFNLYARLFIRFLVFIAYPLIIYSTMVLLENHLFLSSTSHVFLAFFLTEALLLLNKSFKTFDFLKGDIKNIGMDTVILLSLVGISIYASLLSTSDLALWYERNALQHPIRWQIVLENWTTFISMALQFFCLFFAGFILYWINRHILIKKILLERGTIIYLFSVVLTVTLCYPLLAQAILLLPINSLDQAIIPSEVANPFHINNGQVSLAIMLLSLPIILIVHWHKKSNQFVALEKEQSETELELLKQQINPHFLFNTLNNLYSLCLTNSEEAPEVVLQLSDLMRYVVYQGKKKLVPIMDEIGYIQDYISLQSIRQNKSMKLDIELQVENERLEIAPLLLVILIENAFKHGIEPSSEASYLNIKLTINNSQLTFICHNSVKELERSNEKTIRSGIGLDNLKQRLSLIYPDKHNLKLNFNGNSYIAELTIDLSGIDNK